MAMTQPPIFNYLVARVAANVAKLTPLPGKKFSEAEIEQLLAWVVENGGKSMRLTTPGGTTHLRVQLASGTSKEEIAWVGGLMAGPQIRERLESEAHKLRGAQEKAAKEALWANVVAQHPDTVAWLDLVFENDGDTSEAVFGKSNRVALIKFLVGEADDFDGIMHWRWVKGLQRLGFTDAELAEQVKTYKVLRRIKKAYQEREVAPAPAPVVVHVQPTPAQVMQALRDLAAQGLLSPLGRGMARLPALVTPKQVQVALAEISPYAKHMTPEMGETLGLLRKNPAGTPRDLPPARMSETPTTSFTHPDLSYTAAEGYKTHWAPALYSGHWCICERFFDGHNARRNFGAYESRELAWAAADRANLKYPARRRR